jgi:hypothetical protein
MDISLGDLGVNTGLIFVIIMITQFLKNLDTKNKFSKFYVLIPLLLSVGISFLVTDPIKVQDIITNILVYAGVSAYFYKTGKTFIGEKNAEEKPKDN